MKTLAELVVASVISLSADMGCAASTDPTPLGGASGEGGGGATTSTGGSAPSSGGAAASAGAGTGTGTGTGTDTGSAGSTGAAGTFSGTAGTFATGGSNGGTSNGGTTPVGTAVIDITAFSLTGCAQTVSLADLAAKNNGLSVPKPTQTFSAGVFTIDYTVAGQYGQVGIDFPDAGVDLTGCTISATLSASSWPACGVYAVPFFFDGTLGTVAPYDGGSARFVGEQISSLNGAAATISFKATGAALTKVGRVGLNIYDCPTSVTVGDL